MTDDEKHRKRGEFEADHQMLNVERSINCACKKCIASCQTFPGALGPGDLDTIANYMGVDLDDPEFISLWRASGGAKLVKNAIGELVRVPTIVPAEDENGCIFLESSGECALHPVAPFECRHFRSCVDEDDDDAKTMLMHREILKDQQYLAFWEYLMNHGYRATPIAMRRAAYEQALEQIDDSIGGMGCES